ncbi:helix-turn-helix domain-containing protein [Aureispira anguillae]|uniref:Helix-turn-helix domain-containing protein n=1 Tax=Aureispira anguillae TaxID=2864201 RepID=A0A915YB75_9BACT|nr:helix-turn-helix domain-containing protein [Aureispira anguillae]BDS09871.1 helix-turn-helix domain-containing protein [Aureispira anguillae]
MKLSEIKSHAELSTFIESYWHFEHDGYNSLAFFPDGTFNIFFVSEPFFLANQTQPCPPGAYLMPITSYPVYLRSSKDIYGIRFKAFSLLNIINNNVPELTLLNNLEDIIQQNNLIKDSKTAFKTDLDLAKIVPYLEKIAFELLNKRFKVNLSLREKVNYILDLKGQIKIAEMAKEFGVSRQALHKNFKQHLLISPKELSAIWQLNHFFTLTDTMDTSLTGKALEAGYFDQAHFINAFKARFGLSPTQFMKVKPEIFSIAKEQMTKRFNNYYDPD